MTEIEQKALALVNEVLTDWGTARKTSDVSKHDAYAVALCRAIEQHEAFRQEVSDAVERVCQYMIEGGLMPSTRTEIVRFILPKPVDPLVEVVAEVRTAGEGTIRSDADIAASFRAAMKARGLKIVEVE